MYRRKENPMPDFSEPQALAMEFSKFFTSKITSIRQNIQDTGIEESLKYDDVKRVPRTFNIQADIRHRLLQAN